MTTTQPTQSRRGRVSASLHDGVLYLHVADGKGRTWFVTEQDGIDMAAALADVLPVQKEDVR